MKFKLSTLVFFLFLVSNLFAQQEVTLKSVPLPRSTPEAEGVSSSAVFKFLSEVARSQHEFHSIMVLRHGKVIAESWWAPYRPELRHTLYSCSKSFTATAVGFAVSEGRLSVHDKVVSFFREECPYNISPNLAKLTVRDLLSMTVGQEPDPTEVIGSMDSNWVQGFLKLPVLHEPGSTFHYNSMATYMAGAIVQKLTGQSLVEYLRPRLFEPLGISGMDWETDPMGYNVGGWGLRVRTEDMAKFAQLFLQKGQWNGKQVLPAAWVLEASSLKILQKPGIAPEAREKDDWAQGYGYQMWRSRHNSYRGDGAFGQYMLVLPDLDAVIAITAETADMQGQLNLVWDHLLPGFQPDPLPLAQVTEKLQAKLSAQSLPAAKGMADTPLPKNWLGKTFTLLPNELNLKSISLALDSGLYKVLLTTDTGVFPLSFGFGNWVEGTTEKLGPNLVRELKGHFAGLPPSKVAGSYAWTDANTLKLMLRYIESPHTETFTCKFFGNQLLLAVDHSQHFGGKQVLVEGMEK